MPEYIVRRDDEVVAIVNADQMVADAQGDGTVVLVFKEKGQDVATVDLDDDQTPYTNLE